MQSLTQLLNLPQPQGEGFHLYDDFQSSESYRTDVSSQQALYSESLPSLTDLDFVQRTVLSKVKALRICIDDIKVQIRQRTQLETEILASIDKQILGIRNQRLSADAMRMQGEPRPSMESALMQQQEILASRIQDQRTLTFKDVALLRQELRQIFLQYVEQKNLLQGFQELM